MFFAITGMLLLLFLVGLLGYLEHRSNKKWATEAVERMFKK